MTAGEDTPSAGGGGRLASYGPAAIARGARSPIEAARGSVPGPPSPSTGAGAGTGVSYAYA